MNEQLNYRKKMAAQTRQLILDAAIELFHKYGYENVTIKNIVNKTGMSRGSFYAHFKDKDDLLCSAIFEDLDNDYLRYYNLRLRSNDQMSPLEALRCFLLEVNRLITKNGANLLRHYYGYTISHSDILLRQDRHYFTILSELISKCRSDKLIKECLNEDHIFEAILMTERIIAIEWSMRNGELPISSWNYLIYALIEYISADA